jgi:taurine dioxygenase
MIFLRDQHITTAQHVALGRLFGELEVHPFRPEGAFPEIMVLDNNKDNPVLSTDVWHSDTTFRECPTKYSILRCLEIPKVGGDTLWADMCAAYDGLSDAVRSLIDGLTAVHDFKNFRALYGDSDDDRDKLRRMETLYPNPTHPLVRTHPVTRRKVLYVNPQFTLRINGMSEGESQALLALLYEQAHVPEYQVRLRWKPGTIVLWDNRSTQHYAANDYYPNRRHMERVAVIGDRPY